MGLVAFSVTPVGTSRRKETAMMPPRQLDRFERAVWDSDYSIAILGNRDQDIGFVQVPLPHAAHEVTTIRDRGFFFCGVIAVTNGWPRAEWAWPLDPDVAAALVRSVVYHVQAEKTKPPKIDGAGGVDWLTRLYALQDPR
jgi:hypothetical protein